jgi:hypothetical protein
MLTVSSTSTFVAAHRKVLDEVDFTDCDVHSGTWEDVLAPLTSKRTAERLESANTKSPEMMEVPIVFSQLINTWESERIKGMLWNDTSTRSKGLRALRRAGNRTKDFFSANGADCIKNFWKHSIGKWH